MINGSSSLIYVAAQKHNIKMANPFGDARKYRCTASQAGIVHLGLAVRPLLRAVQLFLIDRDPRHPRILSQRV